MRRLGSGTPLVPTKPVGHKPPANRVTGGPAQLSVRKPITTKPLLVNRVTGGTAPVAGARSGVGRLGAAQRGMMPEGGVMRQRLRKDK